MASHAEHRGGDTRQDRLSPVRLRNLQALAACFPSRNAFYREIGRNPTFMSTILNPTGKHARNATAKMARSIEEKLGLPNFVLDEEDGLVDHLARLAAEHGGVALETPTTTPEQGPPLKPLQQATLKAITAALAEGRVSDKRCIELLNEMLPG